MSQNTDAKPSGSQQHDQVADWIHSVVALEGHIEEAMDRQLKIEAPTSELNDAIQHFHDSVRDSKRRAEAYAEQYGSKASGGIVAKGAEILGAAAGLIDKVRKDNVAKSLRDDYTAYNFAAISYTMLHTTAMAVNDKQTASFAEQGLRTYAGLVQKINHVMPAAVLHDLEENPDMPVDRSQITEQCRKMIDDAWKSTAQ
jgi:ferritin-like metal-binding protein YciE